MGRSLTWTRPLAGCHLTVSSTTTPCQWRVSHSPLKPEKIWAGFYTPIISMTSFLLTHTKLKAELTIQCKNQQPNNGSTQLPSFVLSKSTRLWGKLFPALLQPTKISLTCAGPVVPDLKGMWPGQKSPRTDAPPMIHLGCLCHSGQTHTHNNPLHTYRRQHTP